MDASAEAVQRALHAPEPAYGVSTGFGSLANIVIPVGRREELQRALLRSHAAGMGPPVEREVVRAMMLLRARTLSMGLSGARPVVAERMIALLNLGVTPVVPEHGSLGASGDLAPLAHCALALLGEGEVDLPDGTRATAAAALADHDIEPLTLIAKEGLAWAALAAVRAAGIAGAGPDRWLAPELAAAERLVREGALFEDVQSAIGALA